MADSFIQFSEVLEGISQKGGLWLREYLKAPDEEALSLAEIEQFYKERNISTDSYWPDFDWSFQDGKKPGTLNLWVRDNGGGSDIGHVAVALQRYLQKFDPDRAFELSWAGTCSKPRAGEFGGGCRLHHGQEGEVDDDMGLAKRTARATGKAPVQKSFEEFEVKVLAVAESVAIGDKVRLKPKSLESLGLSDRQLQGGEGLIVSVTEDVKGKAYTVRLNRTGRTRMARLQDLMVHKKGNRNED